MTRFAISHHTGSPEGEHYDLLLESGDRLLTWRIPLPNFLRMQSARQIKDHPLKYLDYEGEISGERGRVALWDRGEYDVDARSPIHLRVALRGKVVQTRLCLDRRGDDSSKEVEWLIYDGAEKLRRLVLQHFRGEPLPAPDSADLQPIREDLVRWERRLAAVADRFLRGRDVDWSQTEGDSGLPRRIRELRSRWAHPWLVHAYRFGMRLDRWARHLRAYHTVGPE